jgi:hypothetical protein
VQPGGDTTNSGFWERYGERLNERVTPAAVTGSHAPQTAVEFAAGKEVGERVLLDSGGPSIGEELLVGDGFKQGGRHDQPADPERRRQGLAGRASVDNPAGVEALERSDRSAVEAVLRVVVVLDRDRIARAATPAGPCAARR